jgi:hypothetical protein
MTAAYVAVHLHTVLGYPLLCLSLLNSSLPLASYLVYQSLPVRSMTKCEHMEGVA